LVPVGFTLQPDERFLDLLSGMIEREVDYYEVAPETLWRLNERGELVENGFFRRFSALAPKGAKRSRGARARDSRPKAFVAHGVGFSVGTSSAADAPRRRAWIERLRRDHSVFEFLWYTDHLGASSLGGMDMGLPLPLPMTARSASIVRRSLAAMQGVVPDVGVENNVAYFMLGDPLDEPAFLKKIVSAPRTHLLLDLHNVYTMAQNFGFDPDAYIARLDLGRVIEIHLSGGTPSDGALLPSGRVMRLDSHDSAVPEEVFGLYERVAPRCPALRGVTLERMEGTVREADVPALREELRRVRRVARRLR
jgi:uncharacterized protein